MIIKLFKYDFMNIGKKLIPFYIAAFVLSIINRIFITTANINNIANIQTGNFSDYQLFVWQIQFFFYFIFIIILLGISIMTLYVTITRYHNSIYGSEGYLTNTLPITSGQIIFAKLVIFLIWGFISVAVTIISLIALLPLEIIINLARLDKNFYSTLMEISNFFRDPKVIFHVIIYMTTLFFSQCFSILLVFFSIAVANLFKGYKLIIGVIAYIVSSTLVSTISTGILMSISFGMGSRADYENISPFLVGGTLNITSLFLNIFLTVFFFFVVRYFHKNHLNLE